MVLVAVIRRASRLFTPVGVGLALLSLVAGACSLDLVPRQTYPPVRIQPGAVGAVVSSTVDVQVSGTPKDGLIRESLGSGVIVSRDGIIVTARHVVTLAGGGPIDSIRVILADGRQADAELLSQVPGRDLAFLRIHLGGLHPARLAPDLSQVQLGERVFAVGGPHRFATAVVRGHVLEVLHGLEIVPGRGPGTLIASSVAIRRGFSGGPLADTRGRVIGIDLATAVSGLERTKSSLAVPAAAVAAGLRQLRQASQ
jgi:serine protease Do